MKRIAIMFLLAVSPAFAGQQWDIDPAMRSFDGSTDIGKAMNLCLLHRHAVPRQPPKGRILIEYDQGWESCDAIHAEWVKGEEGTRDKAKADKDAADLEAVKGISKKLPPVK